MPRMNVLNSLEQSAFKSPPLFNSAERKRCFDFPLALQGIATSLRSPINQVCFLTSCGYFRATRRFYPTRVFHPRDLAFVAERCSISMNAVRLEDYSKETIVRHRQLILEFYGFRTFTLAGSAPLGPEIKRLVRAQVKPNTTAVPIKPVPPVMTITSRCWAGVTFILYAQSLAFLAFTAAIMASS